MSLQGFAVPLTPQGSSSLAPYPPWHYSNDCLAIEYWANPDAIQALLPPGLSPDPHSQGRASSTGSLPPRTTSSQTLPGTNIARVSSSSRQPSRAGRSTIVRSSLSTTTPPWHEVGHKGSRRSSRVSIRPGPSPPRAPRLRPWRQAAASGQVSPRMASAWPRRGSSLRRRSRTRRLYSTDPPSCAASHRARLPARHGLFGNGP
jgi:hypothetical protein